jgi:hypothetical protein
VRLVRITGVDLKLFDYDYDLTWMVFFLNADEQVYGRYGGRDAKSAEGRISLPGLRYAMQVALATHRAAPPAEPRKTGTPLLAEGYAAARGARGCIHCHQVNEFRRADLKATGKWHRASAWVYPLPENVGITLDVDEGDKVRSVKAGSPAAAAGLQAGDRLDAQRLPDCLVRRWPVRAAPRAGAGFDRDHLAARHRIARRDTQAGRRLAQDECDVAAVDARHPAGADGFRHRSDGRGKASTRAAGRPAGISSGRPGAQGRARCRRAGG